MVAQAETIVLVTGGGRGIGAAIVRRAARAGYTVAVNYHADEDSAAQVVADARDQGVRAESFMADISDPDATARLFDQIEARLGTVGALVNSAGIVEDGVMPVRDQSIDVIERVVRVNILGTVFPCREAVRRMSTAKGGTGGAIVNISSMATTIGGREGRRVYAATKGAVDVFTLGLAKEVAAEGIRVNAVRPGIVLTDMNRALADDPERMAAVSSTIAMNRPGTTDEIATAVMWLLSAEASFVSGTRLDASGGGFVF